MPARSFVTIAGALTLGLLVGPHGWAHGGVMVTGICEQPTGAAVPPLQLDDSERESASVLRGISDAGQMAAAGAAQNIDQVTAAVFHRHDANGLCVETWLALNSDVSVPDSAGRGMFRPPRIA